MFINESIRSVIQAVLIFAVGLFYCIGSSYTVEVEHDHAHSDEHCSSHHLACDYSNSADDAHSHDGENDDHQHDDENGHDEHPHNRSHSHSHTVSVDVPAACLAKFTSTNLIPMAKFSYARVSVTVPDGPFYDIIVPPQVS